MPAEADFRFGEGGQETLKNVVAAMIGDYVEGAKPDEDRMLQVMEEYVSGLPSLYRMGLIWILRALEVAPFAMGYRHQFSNLPREDQTKVLESFEKSANYVQRGAILILKCLILLNYFSEPEMEQAVGYDHRCLLEVKNP